MVYSRRGEMTAQLARLNADDNDNPNFGWGRPAA